jgi:N-acetylneuraminate synthase
VYLAIPLQKGQISCRELIDGEVLTRNVSKDQPITIDSFDSPYAKSGPMRELIMNRGLDPQGLSAVVPQADGQPAELMPSRS